MDFKYNLGVSYLSSVLPPRSNFKIINEVKILPKTPIIYFNFKRKEGAKERGREGGREEGREGRKEEREGGRGVGRKEKCLKNGYCLPVEGLIEERMGD